MPEKLSTALNESFSSYFIYAFSLVSALAWSNAVQKSIGDLSDVSWKRWAYAAGITVVALLVIFTIAYFRSKEDDEEA